MKVWEQLEISDEERALLAKAGLGTQRHPPGSRPGVIVVDVNAAFVYDEYPTSDGATARPAVLAIRKLLDGARARSVPIFYTTGVQSKHQAARGRWRSEFGCADHPLLSRPEANRIVPEVAPGPEDIVIEKARPSAFWGTGLIDMLIFERVDTVIVAGLTTGGCVRATVVDAFSHNLAVMVPAECVADRGERSQRVHLFDMHMRYADVVSLPEVLEYLESCPGPDAQPAGRAE